MSKILNDIATDTIHLTECLQRLLIIANKTNNSELSEWCSKELTGYCKNKNALPDYRKFKSRNIIYSGINGRFQITGQPMQPGYLSEKSIKAIEDVFLFESISEVEKRKDNEDSLARDLTYLSSEVYNRTKDEYVGIGVQCTSIQQIIPQQFYGEVFSAVKTRVINLLCYYENKNVDLDNLDVSKNRNDSTNENATVFNKIVIEGNTYSPPKKEKKIMWNVIIPTITGVVGGIISGVLVYFITNVWMK